MSKERVDLFDINNKHIVKGHVEVEGGEWPEIIVWANQPGEPPRAFQLVTITKVEEVTRYKEVTTAYIQLGHY